MLPDRALRSPMNAVSSEPPESGTLLDASGLPRTFGRYTLFELIGKGGMAEILPRARRDRARRDAPVGGEADFARRSPTIRASPRCSSTRRSSPRASAIAHRAGVRPRTRRRTVSSSRWSTSRASTSTRSSALHRAERSASPSSTRSGSSPTSSRALDYAHRRTDDDGEPLGIVHRDVSPSNVLISFDGEVKLCDFGIAHANDLVREGASEALKGKAGYMSPEHARGEPLDARADVFAAGIILWELLAGRRLYKPRRASSRSSSRRAAPRSRRSPSKGLPNRGRARAHRAAARSPATATSGIRRPARMLARPRGVPREGRAPREPPQARRVDSRETSARSSSSSVARASAAAEEHSAAAFLGARARSKPAVRAAASSAVVPAAARVPATRRERRRDEVRCRGHRGRCPTPAPPAPPEAPPEPTPTPVEDKPRRCPPASRRSRSAARCARPTRRSEIRPAPSPSATPEVPRWPLHASPERIEIRSSPAPPRASSVGGRRRRRTSASRVSCRRRHAKARRVASDAECSRGRVGRSSDDALLPDAHAGLRVALAAPSEH